MSAGDGGAATWPADIIHVNEDGWVLINRGRRHGVLPGLRLLVIGNGIRELRDLFASAAAGADVAAGDVGSLPPVLRTRRTYEHLDVVHSEDACAVAVATRTPLERRPEFYRGLEGELLVWVPLPTGFTWPRPGAVDDLPPEALTGGSEPEREDDAQGDEDGDENDDENAAQDAGTDDVSGVDTPPELGEQDDERWEEALPLNGVNVGDFVVPAVPVSSASVPAARPAPAASASTSATTESPDNPFESGRAYEWMKPEQ